MKRIFVLIISVLLSAEIITSYAANLQEEEYRVRTTFSASSVKELEAITFGHITVNGDASSEVVVEVLVQRNKNKNLSKNVWFGFLDIISELKENRQKINLSEAEIKQFIDENYNIEIGTEKGKLSAIAKPKRKNNSDWKLFTISFTISVPKQVNSTLHATNGNIRITDLSGKHGLKTDFGYFAIKNIAGSVTGNTKNGSILVTDAIADVDLTTNFGYISVKDCKGKMCLKTTNGSIKLNRVVGNISVSSGFGYLQVENVYGTLSGETSNGSISLKNSIADIDLITKFGYISAKECNGTLNLKTANGDVLLEGISGNVNAINSYGGMNVKMNSVNKSVILSSGGNVKLTLPNNSCYDLNVKGYSVEATGMKQFFSGSIKTDRIEGTIGNGGAQVQVKTPWRAKLEFI